MAEGIRLDVSVVILNWNTCALLEKCLCSIRWPYSGLELEIIVVDNNSADNSREMVREKFPHVRLIHNPENIGFGRGNNSALPHATGRYVLFLNSDTVVVDDAIGNLVRYADAHPDIGILGPKLLNGDGSLQYSCRRYPNLGTGFFRNTPLGRLFPKNNFTSDYLMSDWDHATVRDVDWVSAAALLIRRTLLDQIKGFDDDFYMYCEDVDLCWRANHTERQEDGASAKPEADKAIESPKGKAEEGTWRVTYFPEAVIYHLIGKSSDLAPTRMTYEFHRSQHLFYKKHYAASTPIALRPLIPVGIWARAVGQMTRYKTRHLKKKYLGISKGGRA